MNVWTYQKENDYNRADIDPIYLDNGQNLPAYSVWLLKDKVKHDCSSDDSLVSTI